MIPEANIPFLKFQIGPNDVENLRLIKYEEKEPHEPEYVYFFENMKTGKFYCVWEQDSHNIPSAENALQFAGDQFSKAVEILPKHTDWYQTHWIYEIS